MQIRYKHQRFQTEAARSIANAFTGQPKSDGQSDHTIDQGKNKGLFKLAGFGNKNVVLAREAVCENVRAVQTEQGLKPVDYLQDLQGVGMAFTIEMETGTGKTYTYIKTMYELNEPIEEGKARYTNYSPEADKDKGNLIRQQNGICKNITYSIYDLNLSDSLRGQIFNKKSYPYISIPLNDEYTDKQGRKYKNYGSYIMQQYYEHPEYFKNSYQFAHHVCPGFYFKSTDGIGVMSEIYLTELHIGYKALHNGVSDNAQAILTGTEEVLQTTTFINDKTTIKDWYQDEIDVNDYDSDQIGSYISAYGGDEFLGDSEGAERNQLIAECIFETDLLCGDYDY